jgi:hypothetical protein
MRCETMLQCFIFTTNQVRFVPANRDLFAILQQPLRDGNRCHNLVFNVLQGFRNGGGVGDQLAQVSLVRV